VKRQIYFVLMFLLLNVPGIIFDIIDFFLNQYNTEELYDVKSACSQSIHSIAYIGPFFIFVFVLSDPFTRVMFAKIISYYCSRTKRKTRRSSS
jgi:hypothetical protein